MWAAGLLREFFSKQSNLKTSGVLMGKRRTDLSKGQSERDLNREREREREAKKIKK